jgi:PadR family transcriptional regulator, regulatory protein PadR
MSPATTLEAQALAKTIHELLVLAVLRDGDRHGYQIALDVEEQSEGAFVFQHGTLYPILHRLEADRMVRGRWSGARGQRRRKVYALTAAGRQRLEAGRESCRETFERLLDFLE